MLKYKMIYPIAIGLCAFGIIWALTYVDSHPTHLADGDNVEIWSIDCKMQNTSGYYLSQCRKAHDYKICSYFNVSEDDFSHYNISICDGEEK